MSTQSLPPRLHTRLGRLTFALLIGVVLALFNLLPSVAFAHVHEQAAATSPDPTYVLDKVGVSLVRLEVISTNGSDAQPRNLIICTGLGALVASVPDPSKNTYLNWVLTDASLLIPGSPPCTLSANSPEEIQVLASDEYTQTNPSLSLLGTVSCASPTGTALLACHDEKNPSVNENLIPSAGRFALFSFQTAAQQPHLTPAHASTPARTAIGLTNAGHPFPFAKINYSQVNTLQKYQVPAVIPSTAGNPPSSTNGSPTPTIAASNSIEPGTPLVDATGKLAGMSLSSGAPLDLSSITPAVQHLFPGALAASAWDNAMDAYNQGTQTSCQAAHNDFQQLARSNPALKAAAVFAGRAQTCAQQTTPESLQLAQSNNPSFPLLIGLMAGLIVLLLLLILATLQVGRAHRHRRELARFAAEQAEAQRLAEAELVRQRAEVPCPNCHQPVHLSDTLCRNCRYPLSPSASGLNIQLAGSGPLAATAPIPSAPLSMTPPGAPSVSDIPTVLFPPQFGANGGQHGEEITIKGGRSRQPEATAYDLPSARGSNLSMTVSTSTDPGLKRKHKPNEDNHFAARWTGAQHAQAQQFGLFLVADGMGGHADGRAASRQAIQAMIDYMLPRLSGNTPMSDEAFRQLLSDGVQNANLAVHNRNLEAHADMGTTTTAALVVGTTAYVANVGDSRTYLYRQEQGLRKVTMDHSVVASLVEAGIIQPDDIYTHPKRNQIYRNLGEKPVVEVDTFKEEMQPGDRLLLCSDGLWDMVRDPAIQQILSKPTSDLDRVSQDLIEAALRGGGEDNVTVIVVQFAELATPAAVTGMQILAIPDTVSMPGLPAS